MAGLAIKYRLEKLLYISNRFRVIPFDMVFSSVAFIFYFLPIFFLVYYNVPARFKNIVILTGSIFFYAWGAPRFVIIVFLTTMIDFFIVRYMSSVAEKRKKMLLLILSLFINLGLLFYFKYCNFFVENVNRLLASTSMRAVSWTQVIMPIGISFYTFETLTYVVDVYKGKHQPFRNFWDYQVYIMLFPKLIAGPIIQFHDFAVQVYDHTSMETFENRLRGFYRFFIGLGKKVLIANVMGAAADKIFAIPYDQLSTTTAWYGAISYTFQIYFDFSGYSDMAIGLGLMMGFRFPENFNNPYTAESITDFWRKWHITLGSWMRNYLYIPLGGNKVNSKARLFFNLWLVFLLSGLWHGAAWGFIFWGAYHGFFLIIERMFLGKWLSRIGKLSVIYTFPVVVVGWVFFRIEYLRSSISFLGRMFAWHPQNTVWEPDPLFFTTLCLSVFFSFFVLFPKGTDLQQKLFFKEHSMRSHYVLMAAALAICVLSVGRITATNFNPFIYFRF